MYWFVRGILASFLFISFKLFAGCSPYIGDATINELYKEGGNNHDVFLEFKLLDTSISDATYDNWTLKICHEIGNGNNTSNACDSISVSEMNDSTQWLWIDHSRVDRDYIDFQDGFDFSLLDENNHFIDYIQIDGYSGQNFTDSCSYNDLEHVFTVPNTITNGTKILLRQEDGTGSWIEDKNTNTYPETQGGNNDGFIEPIAEYRFDETQYNETAGEIVDSISGLNGLAKNSQPVEGKVCNAIDLSDTGIGDYAILDKNILTGKTDFSISVWAKTSKTGNQGILSGAGASNNELLMWFPNHTRFRPFLKNIPSISMNITSIADDNWHHLVWTREGSQSCLYEDKILQGCRTQLPISLSIQSLILGQEQDSIGGGFSSSQAFDGLLDELLIFDSALTQTDIKEIYKNQYDGLGYDGSTRNCQEPVLSPPVLDVRFDETDWTAANSVLDSSGNDFHANAVQVTPTDGFICHAADLSATGIEDYITLDRNSLAGRNNFSISLWYKTQKIGQQSLISGSNSSNMNEFIFFFNDSVLFRPYIKGNTRNIITDSISVDVWHHLVWTRSGSTNLFYHDGVLQAGSASLPNGALGITSLILGQEQDSLGGDFDSSQSVEGLIDELLIFERRLSATEVSEIFNNQTNGLNYDGTARAACAPLFDHFEIIHDGQGLTCEAENFTIKACANASCSILNLDNADVQLLINDTADQTITVSGGSTSASFAYTNIGAATLSLDQTYECKNGGSTSCDVIFAEAGFVLDINGINDVESCDSTKSLLIKAVKLSDDGVSCAPAFTGNQSLDFIFDYQQPSVGTKVPALATIDMAAAGISQPRTITFDSSGKATLSIEYKDAGELSFSVAEVASSGVSSATLNKVFYPAQLVVSTALSSTDSSGIVTQTAGVDFPINVIAQCQDGTVTGNYSPQTDTTLQLSVQQKEPITNTGGLKVGNVTAAATNLATTTWTDVKQSTVNFNGSYSEVGIINLAARDTNYLGHVINSANYNTVGRFIPAYFTQSVESNGNLIANHSSLCTSNNWVYSGQTHENGGATVGSIQYESIDTPMIKITAFNHAGEITKNYTEAGFNKLLATGIDILLPIADDEKDRMPQIPAILDDKIKISAVMSAGDDPEPSGGSGEGGVLIYSFNDTDHFIYEHNILSKYSPFTAKIPFEITKIEDTDFVNLYAGSNPLINPTEKLITQGVEVRFGRWRMENSFAPETSNLPMPMYIEQYNGSGSFITNPEESCISGAVNSKVTSGVIGSGGLALWDYRLVDLDITDSLLTGHTNASITSSTRFDAGVYRELIFSAPMQNRQGSLKVEYQVPHWLQYDWNGDGNFDQNPTAIATFGLFRGNDRIIYQREVHN